MDGTFTTSERQARRGGFTLVELMITLAIGAILTMLAIPSFSNLIVSNRLTTTANSLSDSLAAARMEAVKLNAPVQFCGSGAGSGDALATACAGQPGGIYELPQGATTASLVRAAPATSRDIATSGLVGVRFSGQGIGWMDGGTPGAPYNGTVAVVCSTRLTTNNQRILSMSAGSIVSVTSASGSCP